MSSIRKELHEMTEDVDKGMVKVEHQDVDAVQIESTQLCLCNTQDNSEDKVLMKSECCCAERELFSTSFQHSNIQSCDTPFTCEVNSTTFTNSGDITGNSTKHASTGDEYVDIHLYKCEVSSALFTKPSDLKGHTGIGVNCTKNQFLT